MEFVGVVVVAGWIISVCFHEFGHALVAYWGGDTSVKEKGYLTLNPLKYTDPGLSLGLPIIFLLLGGIALPGAAVYINSSLLRNRGWKSAVSAAGPVASFLCAIVMAIPFQLGLMTTAASWLTASFAFLIALEIYAVLLNLLPLPGLDGYGIIEPWLPQKTAQQLNQIRQYGIALLFGLLWFTPQFNQSLWSLAYRIITYLGIPQELVREGATLFRQHAGIFVIGFVAIALLLKKRSGKPNSPEINTDQPKD